ncbi:hypothetical protein Goklo_015818, partial [Gossypium klotzschianum]|nr:hypothetical protein [Gossypium klotzschianum]
YQLGSWWCSSSCSLFRYSYFIFWRPVVLFVTRAPSGVFLEDFSLEQLFSRCDLGSCFLAFFLAYSKVATIEEDINELLAKLNFSEEEAMRVVSTKVGSTSSQGFETWAIGKLMAEEKVNREAIYRVFKSLWFSKEEVNFVSLKEGAILVKFGNEDDRKRILNLSPWLFYQCLFHMVPYVKDKKYGR